MSTFRFKHFQIKQSMSAMKVGTDAMLLGAIAEHPKPSNILDIGSGTGVIALMLAQRYKHALVEAVEIEESAFLEASDNIRESGFSDRVKTSCIDYNEYEYSHKFSLIVSNPPYFINSLKNFDRTKILARHADSLSAFKLLSKSVKMLEKGGRIQVIIPYNLTEHWELAGLGVGLYLNQKIEIQGKRSSPVNRAILTFELSQSEKIISRFVLRNDDNSYTEEYIELTRDFHDRELR